MMIVLSLWLILSSSAAAPLLSNVDKEATEEDLGTDDIDRVDIVNGDGMDSDGLHNHTSQNTSRDAKHIFYGGDINFSGTIHSTGDHASINIGSISSNADPQGPHNEPDPQGYVQSPLEECLDLCQSNSCQNDRNVREGCNQMFSCAHGCKLRHLGVEKGVCQDLCERNGQSGCSPNVSGWKFDLCRECNRGGCTKWPQVGECEQGCNFYKGDECQGKPCGELCGLGVCDGYGFCVNHEENPCEQHGCGGKSCGDVCLQGDILGTCDIDGNCDFDTGKAIDSCNEQAPDLCTGKGCGEQCDTSLGLLQAVRYCQPDGSCGTNARPSCPETRKKVGENCGSCFCPPTFSAGTCEDGLICKTDPRIPDRAGVCEPAPVKGILFPQK